MTLKYNNENYLTIKQVLVQEFKLSSRLILKLKRAQQIYKNNSSASINDSISPNDIISVNLDFIEDSSNIIPTKMNLDILFEDDCLLIINKPSGIPIHPSFDHYDDSLSNGIKYYFDSQNLHRLIRPVNRLDRNTSGIVVFAKNEYIQESLIRQMQTKEFQKEYIAICDGYLNSRNGIINLPISRKENSIIERTVNSSGDTAITKYTVLSEFDNMSELLINLETGRTHQIRVHMSYIGHPVIGDDLYGKKSNLINRQALHAYRISFIHPLTHLNIVLFANLPKDFSVFTQIKLPL